jgi:hypothetical protein
MQTIKKNNLRQVVVGQATNYGVKLRGGFLLHRNDNTMFVVGCGFQTSRKIPPSPE